MRINHLNAFRYFHAHFVIIVHYLSVDSVASAAGDTGWLGEKGMGVENKGNVKLQFSILKHYLPPPPPPPPQNYISPH